MKLRAILAIGAMLLGSCTSQPQTADQAAEALAAGRITICPDGSSLKGKKTCPTTSPTTTTTSFVAIDGGTIGPFIEFLEGVLGRPAGSPDYGPMHVDGAYTVFRMLNSARVTLAAFPPVARQRSSPSDVTPGNMILDQWSGTERLAALLRRLYNRIRR